MPNICWFQLLQSSELKSIHQSADESMMKIISSCSHNELFGQLNKFQFVCKKLGWREVLDNSFTDDWNSILGQSFFKL